MLYMYRAKGQFGLEEETFMPVSLVCNEKAGMDDKEFTTYLFTAIRPLYPNAAPEKGKWVILKFNSGPG